MKDVLEFTAWIVVITLLVFLFDGDPDIFDLLLKATKEKLQ